MKRTDLFIKAIETLYNSWGSDAPPEVIWGLNDLVDWIEEEYNLCIGVFKEINKGEDDPKDYEEDGIYYDHNQRLIKKLRELLK